ncbi:MAG: VanZ family protein [Proteobacteria bacterium]|nr:VanZ family protein [Pseudomonadota bacterium]
MLFLLRVIPMLLVMGIIFFFSHQSGNTLRLPSLPGVDKICHIAIYGLLAMAVLWYFNSEKQLSLIKVALKTVFFCLVYAMSDEFHQSFIPQRSVSGLDLLADLMGAIVVCVIWLNSRKFRVYLESWYKTLARELEKYYVKNNYRNDSSEF